MTVCQEILKHDSTEEFGMLASLEVENIGHILTMYELFEMETSFLELL